MNLPAPIRAYLATRDADSIAALFTADGTAFDEGRSYSGPDAIRAWRRNVADLYTYTSEVTSTRRDGDAWVVALHLVGDFPGGEADLEQRFLLAGDKIADLRIG